MNTDFLYSTNFYAINQPELSHTCMHMLCKAGECSFVFNEQCYHIAKNDLVVIPYPQRISNLAAREDLQVEWFAADYKFLQNLLPANNYGIGGSVSLNQNPIVPLTNQQALHITEDFHRLRHRMADRHLKFYSELMGSLCLTLIYDIFEPHAHRDATDTHSDRTAYILKQFLALLATGSCLTERNVSYYADHLNVSPKYLSATVKRLTGHSVTSYIDRHTIPILKQMLDNQRLSLSQIAQQMNFASLSYFSRYCTKHLRQTPSQYRQSLQPK